MRSTTILLSLCIALASCNSNEALSAPESDPNSDAVNLDGNKMWVTAERINRHTCPSSSCGIVGTLSFREAATVLESEGGWARVTRTYDANCSDGRSAYVDKGNANCTSSNGISNGMFAEWIEAKYLSATRPDDPAETASSDEQLVKDSDDFTRHRRAFAKAARSLLDSGDCTASDLLENGGFSKSTNNADAPVYFTYCGGFTVDNRIYLNAATGEIYR